MKVQTLITARPCIQILNNTVFPMSVAYRLKKFVAECNIVFSAFEVERAELEKEHTQLDKKKKINKWINDKHRAEFEKGLTKMLEADIPEFPEDISFTIEELDRAEISPGQLDAIDWLIK